MTFRFLPQSQDDVGAFAVWLLCMATVLVLHCICDGFQSRGPLFPLSPMLWTSFLCTIAGCCCVVTCGYRTFRNKFRFYQPFSGGDSFVALQTIGYASIASSVAIDSLHMSVDIPTNTFRYGLLSVSGLLQCGGGFFLMFSLSVFNEAQSSSAAGGGFLRRLRRSPQREIALVSLLSAGNGVVAYAAGMLKSMNSAEAAQTLLLVYLVVHVVCGIVTHVVIGWRHTPNYRLFMPAAGGWKHIAAQGFSWLTFVVTMEGVFLLTGAVRSGGEVPMELFVALGVVGLLANFSLLLFVRLAKRQPAPRNASFVTEHGRFVLSFVATIDGVAVLFISSLSIIQHFPLNGSVSWLPLTPTMQEAVLACQKISALFLMALPPLTHMIGSLAFPASFDVWQPFEGPQDFIFLQAVGWAAYAGAVVTGTLSLSSDTWLVAYTCSALLAQFFIHGSISAFRPPTSTSTVKLTSSSLARGGAMHVFNGEMITAFLLSGSSVVLRVVSDIIGDTTPSAESSGGASYPISVLLGSATAMWAVATPLAHISGRDKGIAIFQPFSGSAEYVALQAVGWTLYAIVLILSAVSVIEGDALSPLLCTMEGIVSLVPFALVAMSVYCETWHKTQAGSDSPRLGSSPLKKPGQADGRRGSAAVCETSADDRAEIRRVMASTSSQWLRAHLGKLLEDERVPVIDTALHLRSCTPPQKHRHGHQATPHNTPSRHVANTPNDDEADESETLTLRERSHTIAGVTVFALCVANALLFMLSADFSLTRRTSSVILAIAGTICNALTIIGLHCVLGPFLYADAYKVFMPFTGGTAFVVLQVLSWTSFSTEFVLTLLYGYELDKASGAGVFGMLIIAGILAVASQFMMLLSIWRFDPPGPQTRKTFFEAHAEGTVAVLLFLGAFGFLHTYETIAGGSAAVHPVPLLVSSTSVLLAIPLAVYALRKTYRQAPLDSSMSLSSPLSPIRSPSDWSNDISATPTKSAQQRRGREGAAAAAQTTSRRSAVSSPPLVLVEYFVLLGMGLLPLVALYIAYYYALRGNNVVVTIFDASRLLLPGIAIALLLTLVSRSAPQLAPQWFINLRVVVTSCTLYMIPTLIVLPSYIVPLLCPIRGTYLWAAIITLITIIPPPWNRKVMRPFVAVALAWVMYVHGKIVMDHWHEPRAGIFVEAIADVLLLVFWAVYIPTLRGKPEEGGSRRSKRFIQFMKTWCFDDAVQYFSMRVVADPSMKRKLADPKNKYVIAFHPHGVFPATAMYATFSDAWIKELGSNEKTHVVTHGATVLFNGPLLRDFVMALGGRSVTRSGIEASLAEGHSVIIVTGGQSELILTACSNLEMHIVTHHYGFVRLAVKNKTPLVPMLSFAENNILDLLHLYRVQRWFLKLIGFPFPLVPMGRWGLPFPHSTPLTVVVGAPVYPEAGLSPDDTEGIERLAKKYFDSVKRLFYEHRVAAGYPNMELYLHHGLSPTNPKERVKREQSPPRSQQPVGK